MIKASLSICYLNIFLWAVIFFAVSTFEAYADPINPRTKVGVILGLSGPANFWASYQRMGIELAMDQVGKDIDLVWEDSKSTPAGAVSAFNKLVGVDKVDVIVGDIFAFVTDPLIPLAKQRKIPLITPSLPRSDCERGEGYTFTVASQIPFGTAAFEEILRKLNSKRVALITFDDPTWGSVYRKIWIELAEKLNLTITDDLVIADLTPDFKAILPKVISHKPDSILYAHEPLSALKALQSIGYKGHFISTSAVLEVLANESADRNLVEGVYLADPAITVDFVKAFKAKFGKPPYLEAHASYEAIMGIAAAIKSKGETFIEKLQSVKFSGVAGDLDFKDGCRGRENRWVPAKISQGLVVPLS